MSSHEVLETVSGFPKIRDTILGVPIIRIMMFWGLHWDTYGNYGMRFMGSICAATQALPSKFEEIMMGPLHIQSLRPKSWDLGIKVSHKP